MAAVYTNHVSDINTKRYLCLHFDSASSGVLDFFWGINDVQIRGVVREKKRGTPKTGKKFVGVIERICTIQTFDHSRAPPFCCPLLGGVGTLVNAYLAI